MAFRPRRWVANRVRRRAAAQWSDMAVQAGGLSRHALRSLQSEAQDLRRSLDGFLSRAQLRLEGAARSADMLNLPAGTDWR